MAGKLGEDAFRRSAIFGLAGKTSVQIDDVQMLRTRLREYHRLRGRIIAVDGRTGHIAFRQAYHLAALKVDGGENDHGFHSRNRSSRERPNAWLFSG